MPEGNAAPPGGDRRMTSPDAGRRRVLDAARRRLAAGDRPSVEELARGAGVSRATFYRLFGSRAALLAELDLPPEPASRIRVIEAASRLVHRDGLARLSMDEVAEKAGLSRAALYRIFPGKPALFHALLIAYSPLEPILDLLGKRGDEPPERLLPDLAATAVGVIGANRALILSLFVEVVGLQPDTEEAVRDALSRGFGSVATYMVKQMVAGRLRAMAPPLALASFAGPMMLLGLASPVIQRMGFDLVPEEAAHELAALWLRGMRPE